VAQGSKDKGNRTRGFLVRQDQTEAHAGMVVNGDMQRVIAGFAAELTDIPRDSMSGAMEARQFLGIQVQQFARGSTYGRHRLERRQLGNARRQQIRPTVAIETPVRWAICA